MNFTEKQQETLSANPLEVAMTMPTTWEYADSYLFLNDGMQTYLENWVNSRDESIRETAKARTAKDPAYYYKILKAQELALKFAKDNDLIYPGFEPKFSSMGKSIILWEIEQGSGTCDAATEIAIKYKMVSSSDQFRDGYPFREGGVESIRPAQYMHDCVAEKVLGDFVLRIYGDDRGWGEGAYSLTLTYNNARIDKLFGLEMCGV
jgi:hypothetical protein